MKKLKIAQVSTVWESTPPPLYGGTERIASFLTEGLVKRGYQVTLFATGDSKTKAELISVIDKPLYRKNVGWQNATIPLVHFHNVFKNAQLFDIIHIHLSISSDLIALALSDFSKIPSVFTLHFDLPEKKGRLWPTHFALNYFSKAKFITISNSQRKIRSLNYVGTVYNGINVSDYIFHEKGGESLVWINRFAREKGTKEAIKVAIETKQHLNLAGKIDRQDIAARKYYQEEVEPLIKQNKKLIHYAGEIGDAKKIQILTRSKCLVNPINWDEPFGLIVIEANACGTPVVAFNRGAMKEIIKDGVNGFLIKPGDVHQMSNVVKKIYQMPVNQYRSMRLACRRYVEENFPTERMVDGYEEVYKQLIHENARSRRNN